MVKTRTKVLRIRVTLPLYNFLNDLSKELKEFDKNYTLSELVRNVLEYFFISYSLGELKKPLPQLRKEFNKWLKS
jgi:cell shape-determining protein MreC